MGQRRKRITILVQDPDHGLFYQRLHLPLRHLDPNLFEINCYAYSQFPAHKAHYTDLFVLAHPSDPMAFEMARRIRSHFKKPFILDLDDLLSHMPKDHPDYLEIKHWGHLVPRIIQIANLVVYSTEFLAKHYAHLNSNFVVVPNSLDEKICPEYTPKDKPYKRGFVVGWTGGRSHVADQLYSFLPGLMKFMDDFSDVRAHFKFLCPQILLDKYGSRVIFDEELTHHMDYHGYLSTVPWDVSLVGLYDHPFNDAKSDLKLVEHAPHEIPIIASPAADFIQHKDRNVMLYADDKKGPQSWYEALKFCYENKSSLDEIKKNAKKFVYEERTSKKISELWLKALNRF